MQPAIAARSRSRPRKRAYTWEDFIALPDDDQRELIDGKLLKLEVPTRLHEHVATIIAAFLTTWARAQKSGYALVSGFKVKTTEKRGLIPDVQFYRTGAPWDEPQQSLDSGHPDLAVEVCSPSSVKYDHGLKRDWYASIGTPEYWIVWPEKRILERYLLKDGTFLPMETLYDNDVFKPGTFPDSRSHWLSFGDRRKSLIESSVPAVIHYEALSETIAHRQPGVGWRTDRKTVEPAARDHRAGAWAMRGGNHHGSGPRHRDRP